MHKVNPPCVSRFIVKIAILFERNSQNECNPWYVMMSVSSSRYWWNETVVDGGSWKP